MRIAVQNALYELRRLRTLVFIWMAAAAVPGLFALLEVVGFNHGTAYEKVLTFLGQLVPPLQDLALIVLMGQLVQGERKGDTELQHRGRPVSPRLVFGSWVLVVGLLLFVLLVGRLAFLYAVTGSASDGMYYVFQYSPAFLLLSLTAVFFARCFAGSLLYYGFTIPIVLAIHYLPWGDVLMIFDPDFRWIVFQVGAPAKVALAYAAALNLVLAGLLCAALVRGVSESRPARWVGVFLVASLCFIFAKQAVLFSGGPDPVPVAHALPTKLRAYPLPVERGSDLHKNMVIPGAFLVDRLSDPSTCYRAEVISSAWRPTGGAAWLQLLEKRPVPWGSLTQIRVCKLHERALRHLFNNARDVSSPKPCVPSRSSALWLTNPSQSVREKITDQEGRLRVQVALRLFQLNKSRAMKAVAGSEVHFGASRFTCVSAQHSEHKVTIRWLYKSSAVSGREYSPTTMFIALGERAKFPTSQAVLLDPVVNQHYSPRIKLERPSKLFDVVSAMAVEHEYRLKISAKRLSRAKLHFVFAAKHLDTQQTVTLDNIAAYPAEKGTVMAKRPVKGYQEDCARIMKGIKAAR